MRIKQSICYPLFMPKEMTLADLVAVAAEIGYAAIELWGRNPDFEEVMEELAYCRKLYRRHPQWLAIDVTHRSVEESATDILKKLTSLGLI